MKVIESDKVAPLFRLLLMNNKYADAIVSNVQEIVELQSIDAAPIVHGQWVWQEERHGTPSDGHDYDYGWVCSECKCYADEYTGTVEYDDPDKEPPFPCCPSSGVPMGEKEIVFEKTHHE